ncbi:GNAT family N-acetyltransferase [Sphingomonas morindae]|uniref:GNAT family N-acetyltransferase n=1 Tax=Sphingomonas morindae TaxID=1541170 RepID=A0ABY4XCU6_9SPHN|nr:GNAT family protein [Sphingomonas morindae]USI74495.1 GNAT family N-acetyltransferase [Sphingomonas morindae]
MAVGSRAENSGWIMFAVQRQNEPSIIGEVGFFLPQEGPTTGDLGWWLNSDHQGQGYGAEAVEALVDWCFKVRGLHRLTAHCLASNTASERLMARVGLRLVTRSVGSRWSAGAWHDEVGYALLKDDWQARSHPEAVKPRPMPAQDHERPQDM